MMQSIKMNVSIYLIKCEKKMTTNNNDTSISDINLDLEKLTKILLREIKEKENPSNRSELKKNIKKIVLGSDESEN